MQCPSVISFSTDVPCSSPHPSSDLFNHVCDHCLFSYPDVYFSVPIFDGQPTFFTLCLCGC